MRALRRWTAGASVAAALLGAGGALTACAPPAAGHRFELHAVPLDIYYPAAGSGLAAGRHPVVVFSPGYGVTTSYYAPLLVQLARAGYVVAAVNYPAAPESALPSHTAMLSTAISEVLGDGWLAAGIDGAQVAVVGHSDGAVAVADLVDSSALDDSRVKAAVILSGCPDWFARYSYGTHTIVPTLQAQGTADPSNNYLADAFPLFATMRGRGPHWWLTEVGADHTSAILGTSAQAAHTRGAIAGFLDLTLRRTGSGAFTSNATIPGQTQLYYSG
jgi:hypothetical protein